MEVPLIAGFCSLLILLAASGWFSVQALRSLQRGTYAVDHTHEVVEMLEELELDVREAESALRGYVRRGDPAALAEYRKQAFDELNSHASKLRELTQEDPEQLRRLDGAAPLLRERVALMERLRQNYEANATEAIRQEIVALNASRFSDPLVLTFEQFGKREQQILSSRQAQRAAGAQSAIITVIVSGALGVVCVGVALFTVLGGLERRRRTEEQLQESLGEREILLKEVHHRVKNNLQVISSLLSLEATKLEDPTAQAVFKECRDRIHSMARLHQQLYARGQFASVDFCAHLRETAEMLVESHQPPDCVVQLEYRSDPLGLDLDSAISLGLVANEILLNSLKHAFAGRTAGSITVELRGGERAELIVCDDGIGLPPGFDAKRSAGLGLELIQGLAKQLHGEAVIANAPAGGTCTTVSFPLHEPPAEPPAPSKK